MIMHFYLPLFFGYIGKTFFFYLFNDILISFLHDFPVFHDIDMIDGDMFQDVEDMSDDDEAIILVIQFRHHGYDGLECIYVQTAIYLIQEDIRRFQKLELQYLYLPPLSSAESYVQIPPEKFHGDSELFHERFYDFLEAEEWRGSSVFRVIDRSEEFEKLDAFDFRYMLERQKDA